MFNIHPLFSDVSAAQVEVWQNASDAKTDAMLAIEKIANDTTKRFLMPTHPWLAENPQLLRSTLFVAAYANDVTAERLYADNVQRRLGKTVLPQDIAVFAEAASGMAADAVISANAVDMNDPFKFTEELRDDYTPYELTPVWPRQPGKAELPDWQGADRPEVSLAFMRSIAKAAREIKDMALDCAENYTTGYERDYGRPVPPQYGEGKQSVKNVVVHQILNSEVESALASAEGLLNNEKLPDDKVIDAYARLHGGYNGAIFGLMAIVAPYMLGPDYFPQR